MRNSLSGNDALIPSPDEALPEVRGAGLHRTLHHPVGGGEPYFMKHASAHATKACAEKDAKFAALFDGPNSYYWCLRRVDAGGKP